MARPHHCYQVSLEFVLDFSITTVSLSTSECSQVTDIFNQIINYCSYESSNTSGDARRRYGRARLVKLVYDHAISDAGQDNILRYFLTSLVMDLTQVEEFSQVLTNLITFNNWNVAKKISIIK